MFKINSWTSHEREGTEILYVMTTLFSQETRNQSNVQCRTRHWTSGSTFRFRRSVRIGQSGFVSVQFSTQRFFPEIRCIKTKSVLEGCHLDWSVRPKTLKNGLSDGTGLSCSGSGRDFLAKIVQSGSWDDSQAHPANPDWTWMSDPGKTGRFFPDFFLALQWRWQKHVKYVRASFFGLK